MLWVDYAPVDIKTIVASGATLVSARVSSTESALFNTEDGLAPEGFLAINFRGANASATIVTPYVIQVDQVLAGDEDVGDRRVLVEGGVVGCITVTVDGAARIRVNRSYVFVLRDATDAVGNDLSGLQRVVFAWPINASGVITVDGLMTIEALRDIVEDAKSGTP